MAVDQWVRSLMLIANTLVMVYAFASAFRMRYRGSIIGRIALGVYAASVALRQILLFAQPLSLVTWASVFATVVGLIWFFVEVDEARRGQPVR